MFHKELPFRIGIVYLVLPESFYSTLCEHVIILVMLQAVADCFLQWQDECLE